jgi:2-hydroxychromene-2-carboxylate isomerase
MIEFFFDCSSPWTWLAFRNLQPLARELGVEVSWRPVLVGGIFNAVNPSVYEFRERGVPAKQAYLRKDLQDWARQAGVTIKFPPSVFPVNSVKAMRGCILLGAEGKLVPFASQVFEAYWTHDQDISQDAVLAGLSERVGVEPGRFLVAQAGVLVVQVTQLKGKGAVQYVGVATGMNSLIRPALYGAHHDIVNLTRFGEPGREVYNIVGPICESADYLGHERLLPPTARAGADAGQDKEHNPHGEHAHDVWEVLVPLSPGVWRGGSRS